MSVEVNFRRNALDVLYSNDLFYAMRQERARKMIELAVPPLQEGETLLEIGTGTGDILLALSQQYPGQIYSLDIKSEVPRRNQKNLQSSPSSSFRLLADGAKIPFADQSFDKVFICFVLHHVDDKIIPDIVKESLRVGREIVVLENNIKHPSYRHIQTRQFFEGCADGLINIGIPGDFLANFKGEKEWEEIFRECGASSVSHQDHPFTIAKIPFHQSIFHLAR